MMGVSARFVQNKAKAAITSRPPHHRLLLNTGRRRGGDASGDLYQARNRNFVASARYSKNMPSNAVANHNATALVLVERAAVIVQIQFRTPGIAALASR